MGPGLAGAVRRVGLVRHRYLAESLNCALVLAGGVHRRIENRGAELAGEVAPVVQFQCALYLVTQDTGSGIDEAEEPDGVGLATRSVGLTYTGADLGIDIDDLAVPGDRRKVYELGDTADVRRIRLARELPGAAELADGAGGGVGGCSGGNKSEEGQGCNSR